MAFAGPINASNNLNLVTAVRVRFMEAYADAYGDAAYSSWEKFAYLDDPAGDLIYTIYAEPMKPLRAWLADRPMSSTDFRYWTQSVRTFGDGMELDVDDLKDDANPAKRQMYLTTAQKFAEAALGLWPSLIAETIIKGVTATWLPDGQQIYSLHPYSPSNSSLGNFRNYYANSSQGGSAAFPLNYANLLTLLKNGLAFKSPTGLDYPIMYSHLVVPPGALKSAQRLVTFDRLPVAEIFGQTLASTNAGGDAVNEIAALYAPEVVPLANMPAGTWALIDARTQSERPIAIKKRQDITWQYVGPSAGDVNGFPVSDEGNVSEMVFNKNKTKYGPKARGDGYHRNWWRAVLADGNASPVTSLSIVS